MTILEKLEKYSSQINNGDIMLCRNTTAFISKSIEDLANSYFSHSLIILKDETSGKLSALQSTFAIELRKSNITSLFVRIKIVNGVDIMDLTTEIASDEDFCILRPNKNLIDINNAIEIAKSKIGYSYNFLFYIQFLINKYFHKDIVRISQKYGLVCSQEAQVYTNALDLTEFKNINLIVPDVFYNMRTSNLSLIVDKN